MTRRREKTNAEEAARKIDNELDETANRDDELESESKRGKKTKINSVRVDSERSRLKLFLFIFFSLPISFVPLTTYTDI